MRQVKLQKMHIENFKGLRLFDVDFDDERTRIIGANGTGKTTLHDAYLWLLTGMDSSESAAFKVQPLDVESRTVNHLTTEVSAALSFDGEPHEFKRTFRQKWTRPRGTKSDVLTGNTSEYFIDNVPMTLTEYSTKVSGYFCKIDDFKLISSIYAFGKLDTKSKRAKLIQMAGQLPELMNETVYPHLWAYWQTVKSVESIKKTVLFEIGKLKDEKVKIPTKLNENERDLPEGYDFDELRNTLAEKKKELEGIDAKLQKKADGRAGAYEKANALAQKMRGLEADLLEIETSLRSQRQKRSGELMAERTDAEIEVNGIQSKMRIAGNELRTLNAQISELESKIGTIKIQWLEKNKETFLDTTVSCCPTCKRPFSEHEMTEMRNSLISAFNAGKAGVLKALSNSGNAAAEQLKDIKAQAAAKEAEITEMSRKLHESESKVAELRNKIDAIPSVEQLLQINKEYQTILSKKSELSLEISNATPKDDESEVSLRTLRAHLSSEIESLIKAIALEANIQKVETRRKELETEDAKLSTKIAELDGVLYEISQYQKARITLVEDTVSSKFKLVRWKMYESNLTNDGEREICECLVNGVPVSTNVNTAGGVNAGIDIINALSEWLGVSVPLWVDGKESVTQLLATNAQLITLEVVENQELKVA